MSPAADDLRNPLFLREQGVIFISDMKELHMAKQEVKLCVRCKHFGTPLKDDPCYSGFYLQTSGSDCPYYDEKEEEDRHEESR